MAGLQILFGLVVLVGGAELLVRGASQVALRLGVSSLIVSLTFVGLGTSAPEIAVTVLAGASGKTDLALGNVIGSNVANVGLVIGVCALLRVLTATRQLLRFDVPAVIVLTALVAGLAAIGDGLSALDGAFLLLLFVGYFAITVRTGVRESRQESQNRRALDARHWLGYGSMFLGGLTALVWGSAILVEGASAIAIQYGVSEATVGSTIVAISTSLPEVTTSAVATLRGDLGVAIGNAVGSCIANLGLVLGSACLASGFIAVPEQLVRTEVLAAVAISIVLLVFLITRRRVSRVEATMLLAGYFVYFYMVASSASPASLMIMPFIIGSYAVLLVLTVYVDLRTYFFPGRMRRTL